MNVLEEFRIDKDNQKISLTFTALKEDVEIVANEYINNYNDIFKNCRKNHMTNDPEDYKLQILLYN